MTIQSDIFDFWRNGGERHVIPGGSGMFPEGWDPRPFLVMLSAGQETVEFGAGFGRLAGLFDPKLYNGIDINEKALELARKHSPEHTFTTLNYDDPLPNAPFYFAYTVFLHVEDEILPQIIQKLPQSCKRFCIAELMGREWRIDGQTEPPVYCRDPQDYVDFMKQAGNFDLVGQFDFPYLHYYKKLITIPNFTKFFNLPEGQQVPTTNITFQLYNRP